MLSDIDSQILLVEVTHHRYGAMLQRRDWRTEANRKGSKTNAAEVLFWTPPLHNNRELTNCIILLQSRHITSCRCPASEAPRCATACPPKDSRRDLTDLQL